MMLQTSAVGDLLERQSCEKAALERLFADASERDTPGAHSHSQSTLCALYAGPLPPQADNARCCAISVQQR
jgi:hypothetical protein